MGDAYSEIEKDIERIEQWKREHPADAKEKQVYAEGVNFISITEQYNIYAYQGKFYLEDQTKPDGTRFVSEFQPENYREFFKKLLKRSEQT